jgi:uncharacterized membrane protein
MLEHKKLSLVLLGSLAVNIFLGGLVVGKWVQDRGHHNHHAAASPHEGKDSRLAHGPKSAPEPHHDRVRLGKPKERDKGPPPRRGGGTGDEGSSDLVLLKHMIRVMGGPSDPRIQDIRNKNRERMEGTRAEMKRSHEAVRLALSAEKFDEAALRDALKNLRDMRFTAQERAQEGPVSRRPHDG